MTPTTAQRLPDHLKKYAVEQNYDRYTPEDQAVWRFIMRQLKTFLFQHAHKSYIEGLSKTGISVERIPRIEEIDSHLEKFGWGAVPVSGFIPPAAFMEFQSLGILPIASDMRSLDHLLYTPAPDIVHEAAGHAPILVDPEYAQYLRRYSEVARNAIISKEDLDQYEAIRVLSDVKENSDSTVADIQAAEQTLERVNKSIRYTSEAGLLSRMNWWTAEYGLIGDVKEPQIFGAGLLSSLGESRDCLGPKVKKIPLSVECVNYSYDITEPQPQLFVTPNFQKLHEVLDQLANRLSFRIGGVHGLEQAILSRAVNSVQLNSGVQISGKLEAFRDKGSFVKFSGPCQLSFERKELPSQGVQRHAHGYSTPIGLLVGQSKCLSLLSLDGLKNIGIEKSKKCTLKYQSGIVVDGFLKDLHFADGSLVLMTFSDCAVSAGTELLFDPSWGEYDLAVGSQVTSVFAGPADRVGFGETNDFVVTRVPTKKVSARTLKDFEFFAKTRQLRETPTEDKNRKVLVELIQLYCDPLETNWLKGIELLELTHKYGLAQDSVDRIQAKLKTLSSQSPNVKQNIEDGIKLSEAAL
jgi:phenylalanine-4-hydroxylase